MITKPERTPMQKNLDKREPFQKIFVNRSLNLDHIKLIGFDMDHTLAPYHRDNFENLSFEKTIEKFIENGYPEELINLKFKPNFVIRGLMIDKEKGNILKVDSHRYVKKAYHGHKKLEKHERYLLYNKYSFNPKNFSSIDTFFSLSEVQIFLEIVDYMASHPQKIKKTFLEVYSDVRKFADLSHRDNSIKKEVLKNITKYINPDPNLEETLLKLINAKKELFLLTNSQYDYTEKIMEFIFSGKKESSTNWKDYFSYIIVNAKKPDFFIKKNIFKEVLLGNSFIKESIKDLPKGGIYQLGNAEDFEKLTSFRGDEILYVGDHIYGDIIQSKGEFNWRTLLILEELEEELPKILKLKKLTQVIHTLIEEREVLDQNLQELRTKIRNSIKQRDSQSIQEEKKRKDLEKKITRGIKIIREIEKNLKEKTKEREEKIHPIWGESMKVGLERSRFANQVLSYACLYSSRVSNLMYYSPYQIFLSTLESLPHDLASKK